MSTSWKIAVLVALGAALGAGVALITNAGPHTAGAISISDGFVIGLLFGVAIGAAVRGHRSRHRREAI
jgi:hypothetical protein